MPTVFRPHAKNKLITDDAEDLRASKAPEKISHYDWLGKENPRTKPGPGWAGLALSMRS